MTTTCNFVPEIPLIVVLGRGYLITCVWLISGSLVIACSVT